MLMITVSWSIFIVSLWVVSATAIIVGFFLGRWLYREKRRSWPVLWPITLRFPHQTIKGIIMQITLHAGKEVPVTLGKPIHKDGSTADIQDGTLVKEIDDEGIATFERDDQAENPDDAYTGKFVWQKEGTTNFKMTGDADLGDGVETIEYDIELICLPEGATGFADPTVGAERDHVEGSPAAGE